MEINGDFTKRNFVQTFNTVFGASAPQPDQVLKKSTMNAVVRMFCRDDFRSFSSLFIFRQVIGDFPEEEVYPPEVAPQATRD